MTSLYKLKIQGIRSYAPDEEAVIQFYKPLTIIVGANGTGKTTIIEALRYASCGQLPPDATRGIGFVHDLDRAGSASVKGKVSLAFKTAEPVLDCVVHRYMQVTQTKTKRSFKSLDSTICITNEHGETRDLSKKCADADATVPALMGVSNALLENVIFCHQEESYWPLSDDRTLKAKFDEIFSSSNYSKALEHIKVYKKELTSQLKEHKHSVEIVAKDLELISQHQRELKKLQTKIASIKSETSRLEEITNPKKNRLEELNKQYEILIPMERNLHELETLARQKQGEKEDFYGRIQSEYGDEDSLSDLVNHFENQDKLAAVKKQDFKTIGEDLALKKNEKKLHEASKAELMQKIVKIEGATSRSLDLKENFISIAQKLSLKHSDLSHLEHLFSLPAKKIRIDSLSEFLDSAKSLLQKKRLKYESEVTNKDKEEEKISHEYGNLSVLESTCKESLKRANQSKINLIDRIAQLRNDKSKLESLESSNSMQNLDALKEKLRAFEGERSQLNYMSESSRLQNEISQHSKFLEKLQETYRNSLESFSSQAELNNLLNMQKMMKSQEMSLISELIEISESDITFEFIKQFSNNIKDIEEKRYKADSELSRLNSELTSLEERYGEVSQQIRELTEFIDSVEAEKISLIGEDDIEVSLKSLDSKVEDLRDQLNLSKSARFFYKNSQKWSNENLKCFLCQRDFDSAELESFLQLMKQKLNEVKQAEQIKVIENQLQQLTEKKAKLQEFQRKWQLFLSKQNEVSERARKKSQLRSSITQIRKDISNVESLKAELDLKLSKGRKNQHSITRIGEVRQELLRLDSEILSLQAKEDSVSQKGVNDIKSEIDREESIIQDLRKHLNLASKRNDDIQREIASVQDKISSLQSQEIDSVQRKAEIQNKTNELVKSELHLKEVESKLSSLQKESKEISVKLSEFEFKKSKSRETLRNAVASVLQDVTNLQQEIARIEAFFEELNQIEEIIPDLDRLTKEMNSKNSYLNSLTDEVDGLEARFDSTKQLLNNFEKEIENLEMNIKYRKASAALEDIQSRVETKRNQMAQISGDLSSEQMRKRIESMREEFEKEMRQLSELNGQLSAQQARALEIQSILQQSKESKLQLEHRTANVKLSTSEIALEDLDKYYNAMDKALMAFHSRKMEEINSVLRDLWQTTYKNKDIDFIAIRSDFADQMSRKQYSYRVVMSKEGREMTMKGRCSAGQRVLACILIRMAIAETFCLKCGVLALDEPTTNLDARNIRALAESLNEIITRRREQHGFQLIVITHDEEFVSNLRARDHTDYVYHVSKNENHYSKISRKSLR